MLHQDSIRPATSDLLEPVQALFEAYRSFYRREPDRVRSDAFIADRFNSKQSKI